jgi:hypothetical protein
MEVRSLVINVYNLKNIKCDQYQGKLFIESQKSVIANEISNEIEKNVHFAKVKYKSIILYFALGAAHDEDIYDKSILNSEYQSDGYFESSCLREPPLINVEISKSLKQQAHKDVAKITDIKIWVNKLFTDPLSPYQYAFSSYHSNVIQKHLTEALEVDRRLLMTDISNGKFPTSFNDLCPDNDWSSSTHDKYTCGIPIEKGRYPPFQGSDIPRTAPQCAELNKKRNTSTPQSSDLLSIVSKMADTINTCSESFKCINKPERGPVTEAVNVLNNSVPSHQSKLKIYKEDFMELLDILNKLALTYDVGHYLVKEKDEEIMELNERIKELKKSI